MYLLDTNIVSELKKLKPPPHVLHWIASVDADELRISVATITEIQIGIERTKRGNAARATELEEWLGDLVAEHQVVPLTTESAALWGKMLQSSLRDGSFREREPRPFKSNWNLDLMIASIAIVSGLTVVTENTRDFLRIDQHFRLPGLLDPVKGAPQPPSARGP